MDTQQPLSVTIITLNEAQRIRDALESVRWADEIVVVDSFSTDQTVEICREYTDHVYQIPWQGYVAQKNLATEKTTHNWVFNLDADERVSPELAEEIQQILAAPPQYLGYYMPRKTYYLGGWIQHCGWYPDEKLRLFDKRAGKWVGKALHEKVAVQGATGYLCHPLHHYTYTDIADHIQKMNRYTTLAASQKTGTVNGIEILFHTTFTFFKKYVLQQGFRDGARGLIVCLLSAFTVTLKYAKLWERNCTAETQRREENQQRIEEVNECLENSKEIR